MKLFIADVLSLCLVIEIHGDSKKLVFGAGYQKCFLVDLEVTVSLCSPGTVISMWLSTPGRCKTQNAAVNVKGAQKSNLKGLRAVNSRLYWLDMKSKCLPSSIDDW